MDPWVFRYVAVDFPSVLQFQSHLIHVSHDFMVRETVIRQIIAMSIKAAMDHQNSSSRYQGELSQVGMKSFRERITASMKKSRKAMDVSSNLLLLVL
jgi:hypothetical protein